MKINFISFVFLAIITLTLENCGSGIFAHERQINLSDKYKTDLKKADTLVFRNESGETDTFLIKNIMRGTEQISLTGESCGDAYAYFI